MRNFDVSGELYFIEIKWLGVFINKAGTDLSATVYGEERAKDGVEQTLEYIGELLNSSEKSLRHGYLLIYDARDDKKEIDFKGYYFSILKMIPCIKKASSLIIENIEFLKYMNGTGTGTGKKN